MVASVLMPESWQEQLPGAECDFSSDPSTIAIIGCGPVGHRVASELVANDPGRPIAIFGSEKWGPYNRVRLSSLMVGEIDLPDLFTPFQWGSDQAVSCRSNSPVVMIDRVTRTLLTVDGRMHRWGSLVLATGSHPHVPQIQGIQRPGVFTFRNLDDAHSLAARRASARVVVVLGGGLLGLEVARGMQRHNTEVIVVDHGSHLMNQQLDPDTAEELRSRVLATGIQVVTGCGVKEVYGDPRVSGVRLMNGRELACDTLVVATGIRPNIDLARRSGLSCGRGIRVNDRMQTSDADIYAAGECIEHREELFGLVAPGLAQASVVANNLLGKFSAYSSVTNATRLKVFGTTVFSVGETHDERPITNFTGHAFRDADSGDEVRIFTRRGRMVGASAIGGHGDISNLQESVAKRRPVWPWQRKHFLQTGLLTQRARPADVTEWPAATPVCNCMGVTRGQIGTAVSAGCASVEQVTEKTGAGSVCGSCKPLVADLLGATEVEPERGAGVLAWTGRISLALAIATLIPLSIPYAQTVAAEIAWDQLWRDGFIKQVTGFSLLGMAVVLSVISLRKRIRRFSFLDYGAWRIFHVCLGLTALALLAAHTGLRTGYNLNAALAASFLGVVVAGAAAGWLTGIRHRLDASWAREAVNTSVWIHILFLWPLPVLLGFHILKVYWY